MRIPGYRSTNTYARCQSPNATGKLFAPIAGMFSQIATGRPSSVSGAFSVTLEEGAYTVEWFSVDDRYTENADMVTVESKRSLSFTPPFSETGPAVLYLKQARR